MVPQALGALEVGELLSHELGLLTAADHQPGQLQGLRPDLLHVVAVDPQQHVLDLVGDLVDVLAEEDDVLPLDGGDEGLGQHVEQLVLLVVGGVLDIVHLIQRLFDLGGVKLPHGPVQQLGRLAGVVQTGRKGFKIICVLLLCHFRLTPESNLQMGTQTEPERSGITGWS